VQADQLEGQLREPYLEEDVGISPVPHLQTAIAAIDGMLQPQYPEADLELSLYPGRGNTECLYE